MNTKELRKRFKVIDKEHSDSLLTSFDVISIEEGNSLKLDALMVYLTEVDIEMVTIFKCGDCGKNYEYHSEAIECLLNHNRE